MLRIAIVVRCACDQIERELLIGPGRYHGGPLLGTLRNACVNATNHHNRRTTTATMPASSFLPFYGSPQANTVSERLVEHVLDVLLRPGAPPELLSDLSLCTILEEYAEHGVWDWCGPIVGRCQSLLESGQNSYAALKVGWGDTGV